MICPTCNGLKEMLLLFHAAFFPRKCKKLPSLPCHRCKGKGTVSNKTVQWMKDGDILRERRIEKKITLRNACKLLKMDCVILSEMELGIRKPDLYITYE